MMQKRTLTICEALRQAMITEERRIEAAAILTNPRLGLGPGTTAPKGVPTQCVGGEFTKYASRQTTLSGQTTLIKLTKSN